MSIKSFTLTIEAPSHRNPLAIAMQKRYGGGKRVMKDRRTPRGGASNKQRAYREGSY